MKKFIVIIATAVISVLVILPSTTSAAELTVGATTWYTWWDLKSTGMNNSIDPTLLYGPALSLKFSDDFNLSFVFLYGKFDMKDSSGPGTQEISRTDSDLALNYRLNNYFKIFIGAKYMAYKMPDFSHRSTGPGAGISAVIPVAGNFFILGNVSALYLWGKEKQDVEKADFNEYGANTSISLAYYIESASTTISLGGRYQYFKTAYDDPNNSDIKHHFYGATLSASYTFSL